MSTEQQACDFPALWASYINEGKLDEVLALYNDNTVLMPTFSPDTVTTKQGLEAYFTKLASSDGLQVRLNDNTINCQSTGGQSYTITGTYSFEYEVDGSLQVFPSRFTFVVNLAQERPILHHHSSQVPKS